MSERDVEVMRIKLVSTSDSSQSYTIEIRRNPSRVECNCKGFRTTGRCKHVKFYKWLIKDYLLETPGFTGEKVGFKGPF